MEGSTLPHIFLCELVNRSQDKFVPISIFPGKVFFWVLVVAMIKGGNASQFNLASQNSVREGGGCSKDMLVREGSVQTVERQVLISWDRRSS